MHDFITCVSAALTRHAESVYHGILINGQASTQMYDQRTLALVNGLWCLQHHLSPGNQEPVGKYTQMLTYVIEATLYTMHIGEHYILVQISIFFCYCFLHIFVWQHVGLDVYAVWMFVRKCVGAANLVSIHSPRRDNFCTKNLLSRRRQWRDNCCMQCCCCYLGATKVNQMNVCDVPYRIFVIFLLKSHRIFIAKIRSNAKNNQACL